MRSDDAMTREVQRYAPEGHPCECGMQECDLGEYVKFEDAGSRIATLAAEVERVKGDAERWQQAAKQHAAWVMCTPEFIAQLQDTWSEPVRVRMLRRVSDDVLQFEAERHDCATARADAIEHAAKVCEFRAQSNAEDSHDYLAANEAGKCAVAVRWLITQPERFAARLALLEEGTHE